MKIHGSVSWVRKNEQVWEQDYESISDDDTVMIYPTPLKDRTTLMTPYSDLFRAMENRLVQKNGIYPASANLAYIRSVVQYAGNGAYAYAAEFCDIFYGHFKRRLFLKFAEMVAENLTGNVTGALRYVLYILFCSKSMLIPQKKAKKYQTKRAARWPPLILSKSC